MTAVVGLREPVSSDQPEFRYFVDTSLEAPAGLDETFATLRGLTHDGRRTVLLPESEAYRNPDGEFATSQLDKAAVHARAEAIAHGISHLMFTLAGRTQDESEFYRDPRRKAGRGTFKAFKESITDKAVTALSYFEDNQRRAQALGESIEPFDFSHPAAVDRVVNDTLAMKDVVARLGRVSGNFLAEKKVVTDSPAEAEEYLRLAELLRVPRAEMITTVASINMYPRLEKLRKRAASLGWSKDEVSTADVQAAVGTSEASRVLAWISFLRREFPQATEAQTRAAAQKRFPVRALKKALEESK